MSKTSKTNPDFGELINELERIVEWFERDEIDIDASIEKFERGMQIAEELKKRLKAVENKVQKIQISFEDKGE